jgi:hypothetical protein
MLCVARNMSTAFHPQSDGQTERVNQVLEIYLRTFVNYNQDNWQEMLDMAEFCYNNTWHSSINCSPFWANYGYHPNFQVAMAKIDDVRNPSVKEGVERIHDIQTELYQHLHTAAAEMKKYADRHRMDPGEIEVGSRVFLSAANIQTTRPSKKLDHKNLGPYKVLERIGELNYRLELPHGVRLHDVFHVALLHKEHPNTFPGRHMTPPLPVITDMEQHFHVQMILQMRCRYGNISYLVRWLGYDCDNDTWVKDIDLEDCIYLDEFIENNKSKYQEILNQQHTFQHRRVKKSHRPITTSPEEEARLSKRPRRGVMSEPPVM